MLTYERHHAKFAFSNCRLRHTDKIPDFLLIITASASSATAATASFPRFSIEIPDGWNHTIDEPRADNQGFGATVRIYRLADVTVISDAGFVMDQNPTPYLTSTYAADDFSSVPPPGEEVIFEDSFE